MKITHASTQLTDWADYPAMNVLLNGQEIADVVDPLAAAKKTYDRGNQSVQLQFSARKEFGSLKEAQQYLALHFTSLPKTGQCKVTCGITGDTQDVVIDNAVLIAVPLGNFLGLEVVHRYTVTGPVSAQPGHILTEGGDSILTESGDKIETES